MLKRTITGAGYVAVLVAFFLLRQFVDYRIFHVLTWLFIVLGTYEVARATKEFTHNGTKIVALIYAIIYVPIYAVGEYLVKKGWGWFFAVDLTAIMLIIVSVTAIVKNSSTKTFLYTALNYVYPALLLVAMLCANDLGANGFIALIMSFIVSPCADTFAYLVGSLIGGPKLCPKLSPKKTWSGAIGGTVGGIVSGIIVYYIFLPTVNFPIPVLLFALIGLLGSIFTMFGDLFESFIKRKVGIKDMGKLLPGHGGVMDRIDGTLFLTVLCYAVFALV